MKNILTVLLICLTFKPSFSQKKLIQKIFSNDTSKHNSFLPLPLFGYSQETGLTLGVVGIYSFYADKKDSTIKASQAHGIASFSTKKQIQIGFKVDSWTKQNLYHYIIQAKYNKQPFNFYGIGNETSLASEDRVNISRLRFNSEIEKKIIKYLYVGGGIEYQNMNFTALDTSGIFTQDNTIIDKDGGQFLFLKGTLIVDSRNNITYPSKGIYTKFQYNYAPNFFKSPNFNGSLYTIDLRNFHKLNNKVILALNGTFESIVSKNNIPFYLLRQMGDDQFMRAYYLGRFRDENLITSQAEIRYRIVPRFGVVAFSGIGKVYGSENFSATNFKPTYGLGMRVFFDLEKALAIRLDYAFGDKPVGEKRISGFYISLGEAF